MDDHFSFEVLVPGWIQCIAKSISKLATAVFGMTSSHTTLLPMLTASRHLAYPPHQVLYS